MSRAPRSIAILGTRGIPANYGGFETAAEFIAVGLQGAGFDVTVACEAGSATQGRTSATYRGVHLVGFPVRDDMRPLSEILYDVRSLVALGRRADVIYMFGYGAGFSFWLAKILRKRLIVNCDGLEWARPRFDRVSRFLLRVNEALGLRAADIIIADAQGIKEYIAQTYGRDSYFLPYGSSVENGPKDWDREVLERSSPEVADRVSPDDYYLTLCRIEPDNNLMQIAQGFCESKSSRKLLIVGRGSSKHYWAALQALAAKDDRVVLAGPIYDIRATGILRWNCAAYFHGHMVGGTNPSLLDGLASGSVILATDVPFNREVIGDNGYPAYFFRPIPTEIRDVTNRIDGEAISLREIARIKGPNRIREAYNWDKIVARYCELVRSLG